MMGKFLGALILVSALAAGIGIYYSQIYGFYVEVPSHGTDDVMLTSAATGEMEPIAYSDFRAIDADSSPIRYRACFTTMLTQDQLSEDFVPYPDASPRVAPGWFDCFDAEAIGDGLADGTAHAFLGQRNLEYGIDRVVAITGDGHGYVWHEINDCGEKAYDGSPVDDSCPVRPN
jgi:hypothetical protein